MNQTRALVLSGPGRGWSGADRRDEPPLRSISNMPFVWRAMHILAYPLEDKARIRLAASLPHMDEDFLLNSLVPYVVPGTI